MYMCVCMCVRVYVKCHLIGEIGACADIVMLRFIPSDILESRNKRGLLCSLSETEETVTRQIFDDIEIFLRTAIQIPEHAIKQIQ